MRKYIYVLLLATLALTLAACGTTDHGGYASGEEGCQSVGSQVKQGPIYEADEAEFVCENGKVIEAQKNHVRGPDAKDHQNPWSVDEDSLVCPDGTEITVGDEAHYREKCDDAGGTYRGGQQQELDEYEEDED